MLREQLQTSQVELEQVRTLLKDVEIERQKLEQKVEMMQESGQQQLNDVSANKHVDVLNGPRKFRILCLLECIVKPNHHHNQIDIIGKAFPVFKR